MSNLSPYLSPPLIEISERERERERAREREGEGEREREQGSKREIARVRESKREGASICKGRGEQWKADLSFPVSLGVLNRDKS